MPGQDLRLDLSDVLVELVEMPDEKVTTSVSPISVVLISVVRA